MPITESKITIIAYVSVCSKPIIYVNRVNRETLSMASVCMCGLCIYCVFLYRGTASNVLITPRAPHTPHNNNTQCASNHTAWQLSPINKIFSYHWFLRVDFVSFGKVLESEMLMHMQHRSEPIQNVKIHIFMSNQRERVSKTSKSSDRNSSALNIFAR